MYEVADLNSNLNTMTWVVPTTESDDEIAWEDYFAEESAK